jgi:hypothetical protein
LRYPEPGNAVADNPGIWRFLLASNADGEHPQFFDRNYSMEEST